MTLCACCHEAIEHRAVSLASMGLEPDGLAHPECAREALVQAEAAHHARDLAYLEGRA